MPGQWGPIHEAHSIETAAIAVIFDGQLNDTPLRRAVREMQAIAAEEGLNAPEPIPGLQFKLGADGTPIPVSGTSGIAFRRPSTSAEDTAIAAAPAEELIIDRQSVVYRTQRYDRWRAFSGKAARFLGEVLRTTSAATSVQSVRLEYLDRFFFDGQDADASPALLLRRGSNFIADHVFDRTSLWHSHTGAFVGVDGADRRLLQLTIDCNDAPAPSDRTRRTISVRSAVQDFFTKPGLDADGPDIAFVLARFDSLHHQSKSLIASILLDDMIARIKLNAQE